MLRKNKNMEGDHLPCFIPFHVGNGEYKIKLITKDWWKFIKNNRTFTDDVKFVFKIDISGRYLSMLFYEYATEGKCIFTKNNAIALIEKLEANILLKTLYKK